MPRSAAASAASAAVAAWPSTTSTRSRTPARRRRRDRGEILLCEIRGTTEPGRAKAFDGAFRPARGAARRWQRVWLAEHRGTVLPPISVVPVEDGYAIRDGHHRVSVALARGALTIDARVEAVPA